jgi:hypothetical protein
MGELRLSPALDRIRSLVRFALYSPDPVIRAECGAELVLQRLPVDPGAIIYFAERLVRRLDEESGPDDGELDLVLST